MNRVIRGRQCERIEASGTRIDKPGRRRLGDLQLAEVRPRPISHPSDA